ncbi:TadE/TadG family type IV pilus assembly protein [Tsuneonella mangrovi]|uniref:TadE/TadG family type IV pilus assembly protein n=1 Tax=Tsuneonella mangrovi TaxID=1982042 RepID=UPI001471A4B0|nr:TadE/TadG family type IV pilus assembly protein [Tsuneonella mangrovi]
MRKIFRAFRTDRRGAALVEFALLAPAFIGLLVGTVMVGFYVQNYNAARNILADMSRFAMVEYQRGDKLDASALQARAVYVATSGKYNLDPGSLNVTVTPVTTQVDGVKQMLVKLSYKPPFNIPLVGQVAPSINYQRDIYMFDPNSTVS